MVRAGNAFLAAQDSEWRFAERRGQAFSRLLDVVSTGRPVLVWSTMDMAPVLHTETRVGNYNWYDNEHCVVVCGQTEEGKLRVMDPLAGMVERERGPFEGIYNDCGKMAVTLSRVIIDEVEVVELIAQEDGQNGERPQDGAS
ncbi:MAG: C39 family peptidase [Eggerthellaceae bacterium]|nr:C39 family peptidase [Eggerthellaceae bacterium]